MAAIKTKITTTTKDKGHKKAMKSLNKLKGKKQSYVKVGVLEAAGTHKVEAKLDAQGNPVTPKELLTVAFIAAIHEFGAPGRGIPERSFIRTAIAENRFALESLTHKLYLRVLKGDTSAHDALGILGLVIQGYIKKKISSGPFAKLKPASQKRKGEGKTKPLIDTGQLLNSIHFQIVENDSKGKK